MGIFLGSALENMPPGGLAGTWWGWISFSSLANKMLDEFVMCVSSSVFVVAGSPVMISL